MLRRFRGLRCLRSESYRTHHQVRPYGEYRTPRSGRHALRRFLESCGRSYSAPLDTAVAEPGRKHETYVPTLNRNFCTLPWFASTIPESGSVVEVRSPLPTAEWRIFMSKVWLVTGSASGLGRNIAEAVLASGDRLVATARDPRRLEDLVEKYGDQVRTAALDVADEDAANAAVQVAVDAFGRLDVVVNNAGYGDIAPFEQLSAERFKALIDTNFYGVVYDPRCAADHAKAKERLHSPDIVGGWPFGPPREHGVSRREVGCWRIHRVSRPGSGSFRRQGVCARTRWNADELGRAREPKIYLTCCRTMNRPWASSPKR